MAKAFDKLLEGKRYWNADDRETEFLALLDCVISDETDISNEKILQLLVRISRTSLRVPPPTYKALAARGDPGWLAAFAREARKDRAKSKRIEACRWLQYGREGETITPDDLDALHAFLVDKDDEVGTAATRPLSAFVTEQPDQVVPVVLSWLSTIKPADRLFLIRALVGAWDASCAPRVFEIVEKWIKNTKTRHHTALGLELEIKEYPPPPSIVTAGWDKLLVPALRHILAEDWKRTQPAKEQMLLYLLGTLLALYPTSEMIQRAENCIGLLLEKRDPSLPPIPIMLGPWRSFRQYATAVWSEYPIWFASQSEHMAAVAEKVLWQNEISFADEALRVLQAAPSVRDIPPEEQDAFRRTALEYATMRKEP